MLKKDIYAIPAAKTSGDLLRQIYGTMLAAGTAERDHQILESTLLIIADAGIQQRHYTGQELMHALLTIEIFDHRGIASGKGLEAVFAAGIGQATPVENKSAAVTSFVCGQAAVEGEAHNSYCQFVGAGLQALQSIRGEHAVEGGHQGR